MRVALLLLLLLVLLLLLLLPPPSLGAQLTVAASTDSVSQQSQVPPIGRKCSPDEYWTGSSCCKLCPAEEEVMRNCTVTSDQMCQCQTSHFYRPPDSPEECRPCSTSAFSELCVTLSVRHLSWSSCPRVPSWTRHSQGVPMGPWSCRNAILPQTRCAGRPLQFQGIKPSGLRSYLLCLFVSASAFATSVRNLLAEDSELCSVASLMEPVTQQQARCLQARCPAHCCKFRTKVQILQSPQVTQCCLKTQWRWCVRPQRSPRPQRAQQVSVASPTAATGKGGQALDWSPQPDPSTPRACGSSRSPGGLSSHLESDRPQSCARQRPSRGRRATAPGAVPG
ncbi:uncharacterized protein LOC120584698 isoform X2 [Pteropus medius]|uniref:uncharacterized protein LOC120584698 isoform X2 n=1 Tax=Pteropus vampyrus TaxID=132908 RepID=UPI00196AB9C0|nr:uncharacterized protein LOC120584698 isoform X2 [Pteropus giganteus]